ncbi:MAG: hypothetical protein KBS66_07490 [Eubacterium sp.]|nr:hypothetical protein [Candidatus Colimonas fimequi]
MAEQIAETLQILLSKALENGSTEACVSWAQGQFSIEADIIFKVKKMEE